MCVLSLHCRHRSASPNFNRSINSCVRGFEPSRTVDVQHLLEDSRHAPVPQLPAGYSVYRRPRMAEEGVPANAELV